METFVGVGAGPFKDFRGALPQRASLMVGVSDPLQSLSVSPVMFCVSQSGHVLCCVAVYQACS